LNGISSVPNFMKFYQAVQKLLVGDTQTGDLISLLSFLESRLGGVITALLASSRSNNAKKVKNHCFRYFVGVFKRKIGRVCV